MSKTFSTSRREFLYAALAVSASSATLPEALAAPPAQQPTQPPESPEALLARLAADPLRPRFHVLPQAGFLGDPCAPRFFAGNYHVFFHGSYGGPGWHHAMSPDLIHWRHMPIALTRTPGGYDSYGTFTGGVLPGTGDTGAIIYTGVTKVPREQETIRNEGLREVQCIATSADPELGRFDKLPQPVIEGPPAGMKVTGFRDPFGWKDGDTWYAGVGSGFNKVGGALLLYRSKDARTFEYVHTLAEGTWNGLDVSNPVGSAEMWECPDFFPLGDKHVLLYSTEYKTFWEVGTFDKEALKFRSERKGKLDYGNYYAPRSMADEKGRRILWGWVQESRPADAIKAAGWSGALSLPRILSVDGAGNLQFKVAEEMETLLSDPRTMRRTHDAKALTAELATLTLPDRMGRIVCSIKTGQPCALHLMLQSPESSGGSQPFLSIRHDGKTAPPSVTVGDTVLPLHPDAKGTSRLEIWIDGSVIELFADGREVMTTRRYDLPKDHANVSVSWEGPPASLEALSVAAMKPISIT